VAGHIGIGREIGNTAKSRGLVWETDIEAGIERGELGKKGTEESFQKQ